MIESTPIEKKAKSEGATYETDPLTLSRAPGDCIDKVLMYHLQHVLLICFTLP